MLGRAAYHNPGLLAEADRLIYGDDAEIPSLEDVVETMAAHVDNHVAAGGKANQATRHMVGLFHGVAGARQWRQILSTKSVQPGADGGVLREALLAVTQAHQAA
jgi:tRNA-dihydrouridine synthase A